MIRRPAFAIAVLVMSVLIAIPAAAQYPNKPIHLIVPFPAGGTADLSARAVAQALSQALGQTIIVENRPGADGAIAADAVIKSAPDGYTLLYGTSSGFCAMPAMRKNPPYNPLTDFTPISRVGTFEFFVYVNAALPVQSMRELLEYARANPGKLNYATGNSTSVFATGRLKLQEQIDIVEIPYKGDAPATTDLAAGRVQMMIGSGTAVPYVKEGRLRALVTLQLSRSVVLPDVPTSAEAGLPPLGIVPWAGLFGPARMPKEIADQISREMTAVIARPDLREKLGRYAFEAKSSTPEELGAFLKDQVDVWGRTARAIGLVPD